MALRGSTKTEAVRQALRNEIARVKGRPTSSNGHSRSPGGCTPGPEPGSRPTRRLSTASTSATDVRGCVRPDGDPDG
ncbi:hypothetical protein ACFQFG_04965 [Methylobacterium persicinum]